MKTKFAFLDLTHTLHADIATWSGTCGFQQHITHDYGPGKFRTHHLAFEAGVGTHMDAPAHLIPGGLSIAQIALENLIVPCFKIDVSEGADAGYCLTPKDIERAEQRHGLIPKKCLVFIYTGWGKFWDYPALYRNDLKFPSVSAEAAEELIKRHVVGIAVDTLSPDLPRSGYPVHHIMLGHGKYIIENVANLEQLPPTGAHAFALPIKTSDGTEAPTRLVALMPR